MTKCVPNSINENLSQYSFKKNVVWPLLLRLEVFISKTVTENNQRKAHTTEEAIFLGKILARGCQRKL